MTAFAAVFQMLLAIAVGVYALLALFGVVHPSDEWVAFAGFSGYGLGLQASAHRDAKEADLA